MKKPPFLTIFFSFILLTTCCKKDDANDQLPPATQTGAGSFACKVNGQNFIDTSGGYFNCFYQYLDGEYYFGIQGSDNIETLVSVDIGTYNKQLFENETYQLIENISGNVLGGEF